MLKALVWKECRELLLMVVVALAADAILLAPRLGVWPLYRYFPSMGSALPFVTDPGLSYTFWVAGLLAVTIGLWQTMSESARGTIQFLLHRPVSRKSLIAAKLAIGYLLWVIATFIPLVAYASWAAMPGTHASPFFWSMTAWAFQFWAAMSLIYLGAFLSGIRPARWYASRFLPLIASFLLLVFVYALGASAWRMTALALMLALTLSFFATIQYVARIRDYS